MYLVVDFHKVFPFHHFVNQSNIILSKSFFDRFHSGADSHGGADRIGKLMAGTSIGLFEFLPILVLL